MSARGAGVVYLVGAGPGDPGLMTARSLELIAAADVIFHDRLIPPGALDGAREDAELVYVGKAARASPRVPQEEINELLIEAARAGKSVVRLKGGDPFVFGRGGEEGEALREAGVEFEVVPGVTAGVAASAYAGIPVTHRDDASAVAFVTGHEDPEKAETALDWEALAALPRHPRLLHGRQAPGRQRGGADRGRARRRTSPPPRSSAARWRGQRTVAATLGTLAEAVEREADRRPGADRRRAGRRPPRDARLARASAAARPPRRRHPRPSPGQRARRRPCAALGAEVVELPAIRIEPRLESEEVRAAVGRDRRLLADLPDQPQRRAAALRGAGRSRARRARAGRGDRRRDRPRHRAGAGRARDRRRRRPRALRRRGPGRGAGRDRGRGQRVLVARAADARDVLPEALRERGAEVDVVALYETVREQPERRGGRGRPRGRLRHLHLVLDRAQPERGARRRASRRGARIVSIGPITSEAARDAGLEVAIEAERHDVDGLIEALLADAAMSEIRLLSEPYRR